MIKPGVPLIKTSISFHIYTFPSIKSTIFHPSNLQFSIHQFSIAEMILAGMLTADCGAEIWEGFAIQADEAGTSQARKISVETESPLVI